ncbi:MAG: RsmE family RNA methyltransferase [Phycisphaerae bacterium]|jgi:16S rRNA (uracil1498-N3)-methyltransferase
MRKARFYCETITLNAEAVIDDVQLRHLTKVMRLAKGDCVELFDGKGTTAQAAIEKITKNQALLKIQSLDTLPARTNRRIIIASSEAKAQRFELVIGKCTELGVDRISPIIFERTVKQPEGKNVLRRYEAIAVESAKQCQRNFLPIIDKPQNFEQAIEQLTKEYPNAKIIFGSLTEGSISVINFEFNTQDIIAFIGPEGGFTEAEEKTLKTLNAAAVKLTDTVLRIETAAIAVGAILAAKRENSHE